MDGRHRRRPGHHGGGQPWRRARTRLRREHPSPLRGRGQRARRREPPHQLQVLLHSQADLRQGVGCLCPLPRRLRHPGRDVRAAHAHPDGQVRHAPDRVAGGTRNRLLGRLAGVRGHVGEAGHDLARRLEPVPPHLRHRRGVRRDPGLLSQLPLAAICRRQAGAAAPPPPERRGDGHHQRGLR